MPTGAHRNRQGKLYKLLNIPKLETETILGMIPLTVRPGVRTCIAGITKRLPRALYTQSGAQMSQHSREHLGMASTSPQNKPAKKQMSSTF